MMIFTYLSILGGLVLLALGAEGLVRGSTALALRLGITPLVIGLTIVAFGTGSPELVVGVEAAYKGDSDIALGNIIGSNIGNIALILGLAALARPMQVRAELIQRELPLMLAATLLLCVMLLDSALSRMEGLVLVLGAVLYTVFAYVVASRERSQVVAAEFAEALIEKKRPVGLDLLFVVAGFGALLGGARLLLEGVTTVAVQLGISQVVIGLTVVAIGTSLPELATSVMAALKGEADVAFGNVIGSNILNILCVLGVVAIIQPFEVQGLRLLDLAVFVGSAVLVLPLMWRGAVLNRWEGGLLVGGYAAYMTSLLA